MDRQDEGLYFVDVFFVSQLHEDLANDLHEVVTTFNKIERILLEYDPCRGLRERLRRGMVRRELAKQDDLQVSEVLKSVSEAMVGRLGTIERCV